MGQYLEVVMTWAPRGQNPTAPKRRVANVKRRKAANRHRINLILASPFKGEKSKTIFTGSAFICFTQSFLECN